MRSTNDPLPFPSSPLSLSNRSPIAAERPAPTSLLRVIPPSQLPHDPPHPRVSPLAPGYSPRFAQGILLPLEPTLGGQIGSIARAYGLPTSAGMALYLSTYNGAAAGGSRITEESYPLLFSPELEPTEEAGSAYSEDEEDVPPVPSIPPEHRQEESDGGMSRQEESDRSVLSDDSTLPAPSPTRLVRTGSRASQPTLASRAWAVPPRPRSAASLHSPNAAAMKRSLSAFSMRPAKRRMPVIVATVEFEIDARQKWLKPWLASTTDPSASSQATGARDLVLPAMISARTDDSDSREASIIAASSDAPATRPPSTAVTSVEQPKVEQPSSSLSLEPTTGLGISDAGLASPIHTVTSPDATDPHAEAAADVDPDIYDDLERALADLSPRVARGATPSPRAATHGRPSLSANM